MVHGNGSSQRTTIGNAPVYRATVEDMSDLSSLFAKVSHLAISHGAVRVDPPPEWIRPQLRMRPSSRFFIRLQSIPEAPFVNPSFGAPSTEQNPPTKRAHIKRTIQDDDDDEDDEEELQKESASKLSIETTTKNSEETPEQPHAPCHVEHRESVDKSSIEGTPKSYGETTIPPHSTCQVGDTKTTIAASVLSLPQSPSPSSSVAPSASAQKEFKHTGVLAREGQEHSQKNSGTSRIAVTEMIPRLGVSTTSKPLLRSFRIDSSKPPYHFYGPNKRDTVNKLDDRSQKNSSDFTEITSENIAEHIAKKVEQQRQLEAYTRAVEQRSYQPKLPQAHSQFTDQLQSQPQQQYIPQPQQQYIPQPQQQYIPQPQQQYTPQPQQQYTPQRQQQNITQPFYQQQLPYHQEKQPTKEYQHLQNLPVVHQKFQTHQQQLPQFSLEYHLRQAQQHQYFQHDHKQQQPLHLQNEQTVQQPSQQPLIQSQEMLQHQKQEPALALDPMNVCPTAAVAWAPVEAQKSTAPESYVTNNITAPPPLKSTAIISGSAVDLSAGNFSSDEPQRGTNSNLEYSAAACVVKDLYVNLQEGTADNCGKNSEDFHVMPLVHSQESLQHQTQEPNSALDQMNVGATAAGACTRVDAQESITPESVVKNNIAVPLPAESNSILQMLPVDQPIHNPSSGHSSGEPMHGSNSNLENCATNVNSDTARLANERCSNLQELTIDDCESKSEDVPVVLAPSAVTLAPQMISDPPPESDVVMTNNLGDIEIIESSDYQKKLNKPVDDEVEEVCVIPSKRKTRRARSDSVKKIESSATTNAPKPPKLLSKSNISIEKCPTTKRRGKVFHSLHSQDKEGRLTTPIVFPDSSATLSLNVYRKQSNVHFAKMNSLMPENVYSYKGRKHDETREELENRIDNLEDAFWSAMRDGVNGQKLSVSYGVDVEAEGAYDSGGQSYVEWHGNVNDGKLSQREDAAKEKRSVKQFVPKASDDHVIGNSVDASANSKQTNENDSKQSVPRHVPPVNEAEDEILDEGKDESGDEILDEGHADEVTYDEEIPRKRRKPRRSVLTSRPPRRRPPLASQHRSQLCRQRSKQPTSHVGNLNKNGLLRHLPVMPGINHTMFYIGQLFTRFCWHVEDAFLNSVSYLHHGSEEKVWYAIPPEDAPKLEEYAKNYVFSPELIGEYISGQVLLMNKTTTFDPRDLVQHGIKVYRVIHTEGSFVLTAPRAYHAGFNCGYNVAEAVNFANPSWLSVGREAARVARQILKPLCVPWEYLLYHEASSLCGLRSKLKSSSSLPRWDRENIKENAQVVARELMVLIGQGEKMIRKHARHTRVAMLKDVPELVKEKQLGPEFGHGAGITCTKCLHACHFYAEICATCNQGYYARCFHHFETSRKLCAIAGHRTIIVRRHEPLMLLDMVERLEKMGGLSVSIEERYDRIKQFVRTWETPLHKQKSGLRLNLNLVLAASRIPPNVSSEAKVARRQTAVPVDDEAMNKKDIKKERKIRIDGGSKEIVNRRRDGLKRKMGHELEEATFTEVGRKRSRKNQKSEEIVLIDYPYR